jgi:hypothetical protein
MNRNTTIAEAIATLKRRAADQLTAVSMFEALIAPSAPRPDAAHPGTRRRRRRREGSTIAEIAVEILREAQRPLHGGTELLAQLEARGVKVRPSGLATSLLRTGEIERVARGTFGLTVWTSPSNDAEGTKEPGADV